MELAVVPTRNLAILEDLAGWLGRMLSGLKAPAVVPTRNLATWSDIGNGKRVERLNG